MPIPPDAHSAFLMRGDDFDCRLASSRVSRHRLSSPLRNNAMRLLACCIALLLLGTGASAQSRLDDIAGRGTLRVGMTGDYRPFSQRDKDTGAYSGLDVDMANSLAEALGVKLEIVGTTWATLMQDLGEGKFDVGMGGISITLARQRVAFFSRPVMRVGKARSLAVSIGTGSRHSPRSTIRA
jgi:hypothetical protein